MLRCRFVRWRYCIASSAARLRVCGVLPRPVPLCALPCPALPGAGSEVAPSMARRGRERIGGPTFGEAPASGRGWAVGGPHGCVAVGAVIPCAHRGGAGGRDVLGGDDFAGCGGCDEGDNGGVRVGGDAVGGK